ncbi:helix-turn-helix transcriptional regulator [Williamsia muralis]|uniref:helix-turn-helix domain-containing protein n=1 Tax=Williamsia marianensis TaxID=85044 RepID=UPI003F183F56
MATARLVELIDTHKHTYGVSDAELARRIGVSRQNLNLWRTNGVRGLPARTTLDGIATVIGQPYLTVLQAVLRDVGYLDDGRPCEL